MRGGACCLTIDLKVQEAWDVMAVSLWRVVSHLFIICVCKFMLKV